MARQGNWISLKGLIVLALLGSLLPAALVPPTVSARAAPGLPREVRARGYHLSDWTVAEPRLLALTTPPCRGSGGAVQISRVSTRGAERNLFERVLYNSSGSCNPYRPNSNLVADANYVYWVEGERLVRLSVNANPGDAPQVLGEELFDTAQPVELAMANGRIVALQKGRVVSLTYLWVWLIAPDTGSAVFVSVPSETARKPTFDGTYIYYLTGDNVLRRLLPAAGQSPSTIATGVGDYVAEGEVQSCDVRPCSTTSFVFY